MLRTAVSRIYLTVTLVALGFFSTGCTSLIVRTNPSGAKVYVNDRYVGETEPDLRVWLKGADRGAPVRYRIEKTNYKTEEGEANWVFSAGRVVGGIFTLGIVTLSKPPTYVPPLSVDLTPDNRVIVTSGNLSRRYEMLGTINVNGQDIIDQGLRADPGSLDTAIRNKAVKMFGDKVDAVINVANRSTDPHMSYSPWIGLHNTPGTVLGSGLAVRFIAEP